MTWFGDLGVIGPQIQYVVVRQRSTLQMPDGRR